mmetsp:Transcript_22217/g.25518  ORF Transcript_22217/g.25518 Transcript_22217/m.25518 type:complete len:162 (+) Transcript_22217:8-493(+)
MEATNKRTAKVIGGLMISDQMNPNAQKRKRENGNDGKKAATKPQNDKSKKTPVEKPTKKREVKETRKKEEEKADTTKKNAGGKASQLDQLRGMTTVVIDTGDYNLIKQYKPTDATTNPSLLLLACNMKEYDSLINDAIKWGISKSSSKSLSADDKELITNV